MYGGELGNWIFHPHCFSRIQVAAAMVFHYKGLFGTHSVAYA